MTDNEIIKALECCKNLQDCECCPNQPCDVKKGTMACLCQAISNSIDLINRQKVEIDSLKSELDAAIKAITPCCLNCKHYNRNQLGDYGCLKKYEPSGTSRCANWKWIGVKEREVDNNAE